ncbi:MAG: sulfatase-like hydrolase/transferase [Planctomycetes bacterium]|nr:sulfatase-like hydrolase/transferase [Planctomycetota bacterium]
MAGFFDSYDRRRAMRRATFELWLLNLLAAVWQGQAYFEHAPEGLGLGVHVFLELALLTQLAALSLPIAGLGVLLAQLRVGSRSAALLTAVPWTAFQLLILTDVRVYNLFRYHLNGWVWTVVTTEGVEDSIQFDAWFWVRIGALLAGVFAFQFGYQRWRVRALDGHAARGHWVRPAYVFGAALLPALLIEKSLYAHADLVRDREIPSLARLVPFYPRFTVKRVAQNWFGYDLAERERVDVAGEGLLLRYPLERPRISADGPRWNVMILTVESLRADMLAPDTMPNTWAFSREGRRFLDHSSGGSTSRYGTFSLVYGLHGSYFAPVYAENASPTLVDALLELGYDFRIFGTASMSFPEMRSTAWVRVEEHVADKLKQGPGESRDAELVRRMQAWLGERAARSDDAPFFCFAFLDAPHSRYNVVESRAPFVPYAKDLDYLELSEAEADANAQLVFNRYKNSVYDVDHSLGLILESLRASGELERTLVFITGDHGEEFREHGFWGHTSNYTRTQVLVPMVVRGPNVVSGDEQRPTAHVDVAPTVLEALGADPAQRAAWTVGESLFAPLETRHRILAGWDTVAAWSDDAVLVLPLDPYKGSAEVYDFDWRPVADPEAALRAAAPVLRELSEACRRFLR